MTTAEVSPECSTDVLVSVAESLHVYPGLLTAAAVCGGLSGILAAALLYVFCMKPLLLTRQVYNARRLLEPDVGNIDNNQSDCVSNREKEAASGSANDKEKKRPPMNSDVAAFASRAKVVYPINQKYRPLADGASNPSLHEQSKLPPMPNEESSSSSDGESLSQEQDNNDSSQFIANMKLPKSLQNQSFTRVFHYPHTLTHTGFEGRISLYCLALQEVQQHSFQLQEEKYLIFLQMLKVIFSSRFPKDKNDADFAKDTLMMQEKKLNELRKPLTTGQTTKETIQDAFCSLEEIERAQKDLLERILQTSKSFSSQLEDLCQHLLRRKSGFSPEEAHDDILFIVQTLLSVEEHLTMLQEADLKRTLERLLWWEELSGLVQSQPALLRWEVTLRMGLIATRLEQLTNGESSKLNPAETILSEIQAALTEGLHRSTEECTKKTRELVTEKCRKKESKKKKLQKSQMNERSKALEMGLNRCDLQEQTSIYQEVLMRHRKEISDLELHQDNKIAEALCSLWKKLRALWSNRLSEIARDIFLASVPTQLNLTAEHCESLWLDVEQKLADQLQQAESTARQQLDDIRTELERDQQVWIEGMALGQSCLKHLGEQQMEIIQAMVARQSYTLSSDIGKLIEKKHKHLSLLMERSFTVRHFSLQMLKEMRLSKLKVLCQTDFRALLVEEPSKTQPCVDSALKNSRASLAERHLGPESKLLENNLQQEFLSELEAATELLQSHAQLALGNALSHAIHHKMEAVPTQSHSSSKHDLGLKHHLTEAAAESVYLTKDSLRALVHIYYSDLRDISSNLQLDQSNISHEMNKRKDGRSQLSRALLRELVNWGKRPASAEFQQRVELNKKTLLQQSHLDQERIYEELRKKKVELDQSMDRIKAQLMEAEESFITELAAIARVSVHSADQKSSSEEDNSAGEQSAKILDLLTLNPALDPALNPSLTPLFATPVVKSKPKKKEEKESHLSL
ncbi:ellis-van Creveld syndrome protein homolog isoform X1 [Xiphophorus couchianus]|uniref:ellis-van Creveld syndrome protein homolog isoform X1 n=1 Tax=Xiphophorus couchianus TaxID=32473 RepID=UPI001016DC13|nr:ellis-van Creveld syndrome protein isoform X1 [Xiphophorus couchianus]